MARSDTQKVKKDKTKKRLFRKKVMKQGIRQLDQVKKHPGASAHDIEELPAFGQFGCAKCDMFYETQHDLDAHVKTRSHKRRLKEWEFDCHTAADAERAAGLY